MKHTYSTKKKIEDVANSKITAVSIKRQKKSEIVLENGKRTIVVGVAPKDKVTRRKFVILARDIIMRAKEDGAKKIVLDMKELLETPENVTSEEVVEILATNFEMANYEFNQLKTKPEDGWKSVDEVVFVGNVNGKLKAALRRGKIIGEEVNKARTLANMPGGLMTPGILALKAKDAVKNTKVKVKVLTQKEMQKLKIGGVLGVAQGSSETPRFIIMEYMNGGATQKPAVLVGKAVTFDTGGLNLKSSGGIGDMHMDMSGGAAVIQTIALAARLKVKKNIVALIPAVENSPSGTSYRPGDVLKTMSGKTIEVLNTDAEGRIILADALHYAKRYKPSVVVDVATLTGAAVGALGLECLAVFTDDDKLAEQTQELGEKSGDYAWRLPMWEEYGIYVKGTRGDVQNIAQPTAGGGGAITAAKFLQEFVDGAYTWMHVDMAPRMLATANEKLSKGAVGSPVRLLLKLIEEYKK